MTDVQDDLAAMVRDFVADRFPEGAAQSLVDSGETIDRESWARLRDELGIVALAVDEEYGGAGGTFADVCVVMEELGRNLAGVPYFSHVVLAQSLLLALGPGEERAKWLTKIAAGDLLATVAFAEPHSPWSGPGVDAGATLVDGTWRIQGTKSCVVDGMTADLLFVLARTDDALSVFAVDPQEAGVARRALPTLDQTRSQAEVILDGAPAHLVGEVGDGGEALDAMLDAACVALSSESVGGAQRVLDMAVDYAKVRVQFGRKIGSFQAIKHKCADMLMRVESAKSAAYYARVVTCDGTPEVEVRRAASMAKSYCQDVYVQSAADNIQIHGGIGFTWEHPAHLYFKRAKANQLMFGDSVQHRERLAQLLDLTSGE